jgi:hypothetical protein
MLRLLPIPTLSLLLACDPGRDGGPSVCDPFVADEQPSKLRDLLVVGRDVGEELYVVDHAWYKDRIVHPRVFVSDGAALRRVLYEGHVGAFEMQWTFPVAQHQPPFTLMVSDDAGLLRMGLLTGTAQTDPFAIGVVGAELTVVDDDAVDGRAVYNFVSTVAFEYAARTADGRTVVVLGPEQSEDYDHYRLFLGTDELVEHEVQSFLREEDGGTTTINFAAGDGAATAWFPTPLSPELSPTLTIDGEVVDLVAIDPDTLDDAVYLCR